MSNVYVCIIISDLNSDLLENENLIQFALIGKAQL